MITEAHKLKSDLNLKAHTLVVGTGSGGGVAAYYSAVAGLDTIVVEEGGYYDASDMTQREEEMNPLLMRAGAAQTTSDGLVAVMQGSAFGGSTLINTADCTPIEKEVLAHWRKYFDVDIDEKDLQRSYDIIWKKMNVHRLEDAILNRNNLFLNEQANKRDWASGVFDSNRRGCIGSSYCLLGCAYNAKQGTHLTWLPAAKEAGALIYTDLRIDHLEPKTAGGYIVHGSIVEKVTRKLKHQFTADVERVILSAGSVHSPAILKKSGFDKKLPQLGKNVSLQPQWAIASIFDDSEEMVSWRGSPQSSYISEFDDNTEEHGLGGFRFEGIGGVVATIAIQIPGFGNEHKELMTKYNSSQFSMLLVPDRPVGSMDWQWREDGTVIPSISYTPTEEYRKRLLKGAKLFGKMQLEAGANKVTFPHQLMKPAEKLADLDKLDDLQLEPGLTGLISAHVQGSCRMGKSAETSVVDNNCQVHGHKGLYVMDASVMPTTASTHTMIPTLAMTDMAMRRLTGFKS